MSGAEARQRIAAHWPTEDKASRADFVIRTDGSFEDTDEQIRHTIEALNPQRRTR
jgi:dephospho-CoA kinase